ncbi:MAG TPA: hypothetical protein VMX17_14960 [Candidatus Glassbacteria bacterium]|nr:hypothetical protein [Candidatus Glassbacteria bacterium]
MLKEQSEIEINGETLIADNDFIPILKELNKIGLKTVEHCHGRKISHDENDPHKPLAYITFDIPERGSVYINKFKDKTLLTINWERKR